MTAYRKELSVDLYELTMSQVFWRRGLDSTATFSLFFRGYPKDRAYYIAAGIEQAHDFLQNFHFSAHDIQSLRNTTPLADDFLTALADFRFTGDVRSVPEGSIVFADEPLLEVTAPIIEAQLVETMLLNIVTTASLMATKASRIIQAAGGKPVVDFGSRRTHGEDAAIQAAYSGYIAGFAGTSNVKAAALFGIPAVGTMAHSFVQAFGDETSAFEAYVIEFPETSTFLVDTYDTIEGVTRAIQVAKSAAQNGVSVNAIRLDSGDLGDLAKSARMMLDDAGLPDIRIMASGGLDEHSIQALVDDWRTHRCFRRRHPLRNFCRCAVYRFGLQTRRIRRTPSHQAQSVKGHHIHGQSRSTEATTKRRCVATSSLAQHPRLQQAIPNLCSSPAMRSGKRIHPAEPLTTVRERVASNLRRLPNQSPSSRQPRLLPRRILTRIDFTPTRTASPRSVDPDDRQILADTC